MDAADISVTPARWNRIAEGIQADDAEATEQLYRQFAGYRFFFTRRLGPDEADDCYHDLVKVILQAIKSGSLRDPARLVGYARTTAHRMIANRLGARSRLYQLQFDEGWRAIEDERPSAEAVMIRRQAKEIAARVLGSMPLQDRTVLMRFYVDEYCPERICSEMNLSATQFRLLKSRAKARFTSLMQRRMGPGRATDAHATRKTA